MYFCGSIYPLVDTSNMNLEPIRDILKNELGNDLKLLNDFIEAKNHQKIYEFAHRYKLRLFYVNETQSVAIIDKLLQSFYNKEFDLQYELGKELQTRLIEVDKDLSKKS